MVTMLVDAPAPKRNPYGGKPIMYHRRRSGFHQTEVAKAQRHLSLAHLQSEKAAERAAIAAERAAEAAEETAKAAKASALYMLLSVVLLAVSSLITVIIAVVKR